jgi:hypothetical protein
VDDRLRPRTQPARNQVRVDISGQQGGLEEHQAGDPHRGRATQVRQQPLGRHGLNQKKQKGREKDDQRVDCVEERHGKRSARIQEAASGPPFRLLPCRFAFAPPFWVC